MTADEMFKELGYEKKETEDNICYTKFKDEDKIAYVIYISFYTELKNFAKFYIKSNSPYEDEIADISMKELRAINKKVEELQWL